jgi:hypothetical protein
LKTGKLEDNGRQTIIIKDKTDDGLAIVEKIDGCPFSNGQKIRVVDPNLIYDVKEIKISDPDTRTGTQQSEVNSSILKRSFAETLMWFILFVTLMFISWPQGLIFLIVYGFVFWHQLKKNHYFERMR